MAGDAARHAIDWVGAGRDHNFVQVVAEMLVGRPVHCEPSVLAGHLLEAVPSALEQSAVEEEVIRIHASGRDPITRHAAEELVEMPQEAGGVVHTAAEKIAERWRQAVRHLRLAEGKTTFSIENCRAHHYNHDWYGAGRGIHQPKAALHDGDVCDEHGSFWD